MEMKWRARIGADPAGHVTIPAEFAVLYFEIASERHEEAAGHGIDDRRALLHGENLLAQCPAEGLVRHGLEPVGEAAHGRNRSRQNPVKLGRTTEDDVESTCLMEGLALLVRCDVHGIDDEMFCTSQGLAPLHDDRQ